MTTNKTPFANMMAEEAAELAAAEKAAAEQAAAEEAETEQATADALVAIRHAGAKLKKNGGFPAVTIFMRSLSDFAVSGVAASSSAPLPSGTPDPALVAERDALNAQVHRLTTERDQIARDFAAEKNPGVQGSLAAQLEDMTIAFTNAGAPVLKAERERDQARTDLQIAEQAIRDLTAQVVDLTRDLDVQVGGHDTVKALIKDLPPLGLANAPFGAKLNPGQTKKLNEALEAIRAMYGLPALTV